MTATKRRSKLTRESVLASKYLFKDKKKSNSDVFIDSDEHILRQIRHFNLYLLLTVFASQDNFYRFVVDFGHAMKLSFLC